MTTPRRSLLAVLAGLAALPRLARAQAPAPSLMPTIPPRVGPPLPRVKMTTDKGVIVVELNTDKAPLTAGLFLRLVREKRFIKPAFYRVVKVGAPGGPQVGMVQGGETVASDKALPPIAHEPTSQTGILHRDGVISMPRFAPGTARGEFFFCIGDLTSLDEQPPKEGVDTFGFAAFGRVVEGMDVVHAIHNMEPSPTAGDPGFRGQILDPALPVVLEAL
jgi:peptidyl-prolyl cis-trans isomerase A (cyclophilin A)